MASIFTKIIQGEIPCEKIIETDAEIAFLDIMPSASGHTLVIPKFEVMRLEDLPETQAISLMRTLQQVAKAVCTAFDGIDYTSSPNFTFIFCSLELRDKALLSTLCPLCLLCHDSFGSFLL